MILVTGATGNVGSQVLAGLVERGIPVRAMTRDPESARLPEAAEVVGGDLADPGGLEKCLDGVEAVFLMWPFHDARPVTAILAAIRRHAGRVVLLSSGAVRDGLAPDRHGEPVGRSHAAVEHRLRHSGLAWTVLRPSTFAANALWWAGQIRAGDTVAGAFGGVRMAMLHEADIAAVAVAALTEDGHDQKCHRLTGPELLTQAEQVHIVGQALGRPLRWRELSRARDRRRLLEDESFPDSFVDVLLDGYATMLDAPTPTLTRTVETVTGTPARTFHQWALDHAEQFFRR